MVKSSSFKAKSVKLSALQKLKSLTKSDIIQITSQCYSTGEKDAKGWIWNLFVEFNAKMEIEEILPINPATLIDFIVFLHYECQYSYLTIRNCVVPYIKNKNR